MADLMRHTAVWEGTAGLPGYSQFYHSVSDPISDSAAAGLTSVIGLFTSIATLIPDGITVTMDPIYQVIDEATGDVTAEGVVSGGPYVVNGAYVGTYSRQTGVLIEWRTSSFIAGRRLRGRTYLVPLGNVGDSDGTLTTGTIATVGAGALSITGSTEQFRVWHRPVNGAGGSSSPITAYVVRDRAAILNSRMN